MAAIEALRARHQAELAAAWGEYVDTKAAMDSAKQVRRAGGVGAACNGPTAWWSGEGMERGARKSSIPLSRVRVAYCGSCVVASPC